MEAENIKSNASENGKLSLIPLNAGLPPEPSVGERRRQSQARMVGERIFSKTQGTENFQSRSYPRQRPRFVKSLMPASQPMSLRG